MSDTAAHLVDRVLPEVPVRQWVLTLPYPLRYRCAWDARLTSEVVRAFLRALFADLRRRAKHHRLQAVGEAAIGSVRSTWASWARPASGRQSAINVTFMRVNVVLMVLFRIFLS